MAQGSGGFNILSNKIGFADSPEKDAFGRLRVSLPTQLLDAQMTYEIPPLVYESIVSGTGATVTHDSTNRCALATFSSTPTGGTAYLQSYQYLRYRPGSSQKISVTFNFNEAVANVLKFAGFSDGTNGVEFQNNGSVNRFVLYSGTGLGNQTVNQADWNLDKLDGTGPSGATLDITKTQILFVDFQALYVGRVRCGFVLDGCLCIVHEFLHANRVAYPYIQTVNLPVRCGMTCTGTVSTTMRMICFNVHAEADGGHNGTLSYDFSQEGTVTASSGADTHLLSIRPRTTFNSIVNRALIRVLSTEILVTGNNPVLWKLVLGQAISGTTAFNNVNTSHSTMEYNTAGTISGSPAVVIDQGYVPASNQAKGAEGHSFSAKYPITLDAAGAVRANGTLSLLAQGIGGTSACRGVISWSEER